MVGQMLTFFAEGSRLFIAQVQKSLCNGTIRGMMQKIINFGLTWDYKASLHNVISECSFL